VLAHELGHHVDGAHGAAGGRFARSWRATTESAPLTSYCDNDNEWFAEHFRLFVTNPSLHLELHEVVHGYMLREWSRPAETRPWREVLAGADRQIRAAQNKGAR
jgi:hypothetical protein